MPNAETGSSLPMVRLRGRVRSVLRLFHELTGLTAVMSVAPSPLADDLRALAPPVHPVCGARLRTVQSRPPCKEQWSSHLRRVGRSGHGHSHICPLGLCCACVPIHFDGKLAGLLKLVAGPDMPRRRFSAATRLLEFVVSGVCQESLLAKLSEEVNALRQRLGERLQANCACTTPRSAIGSGASSPAAPESNGQNRRLVEAAVKHLELHYQAADLCLLSVAHALGCNPRYLTTRFTLVAGERMHTYLVRLRVGHACQLLTQTATAVKEVAYSSGFRDSTALERAFRRHVGTSPGEYRRIFREG